jgi:hypothetical protein
MKILSAEPLLTIDFERPDAPWVLLVIDDRYDWVKRMVCGYDPMNEPHILGLEEDCVNSKAVAGYWDARRPAAIEPFVRAILFLPWIAHQEPMIAKILFSDFPPTLSVDVIRNELSRHHRVAALIDVLSVSGSSAAARPVFVETWEALNKLGEDACPHYARAVFSRGGALYLLPGWACDLPQVHKQSEEYGAEKFRAGVVQWFQSVANNILEGRTVFFEATKHKPTHNAYTLTPDTEPAIHDVLRQMMQGDACGVWHWCDSHFETVDIALQRRWLAAKAFQYFKPRKPHITVAAVIALVHGLSLRCGEHSYRVSDPLETLTQDDLQKDVRVFGSVLLQERTAQGFVTALREFLLDPEQWATGHAQVTHVSIALEDGHVALDITYSAPLPEAILTGSDLEGSARDSFLALQAYSTSYYWDPKGNILRLRFAHEA